MGQKIHPLGFRLGISKSHSSYWYSKNKDYSLLVKEDINIRNFIIKNTRGIFISLIEIKRKSDNLTINIHVKKPILILGKDGTKLFNLRNSLSTFLIKNFTSRKIIINVAEIVTPSLDARFLSDFTCQQLEKRIPFRKAMKTILLRAKLAGAKGIKVQISGRLNGAEIARTEWSREGRVPLHTLKADIDYYSKTAQTIYGILGVKVWIYRA